MSLKRGVARTQVKVEGAVGAKRELDKVEKGLKKVKERADQVNTSAGKAKRDGLSVAGAIGSTLSGVTAAAEAALGVLATFVDIAGKVSGALYQLGQRGGDVSAVTAAFDRIGSSDVVRSLQAVTGGLVSNTELMARYTQAMRTNIVSQSEFTSWMETTTRAAQDMGRDVSSSIAAVTTAMAGGGMEGLAQLGVNIFDIRDSLQQMGMSMETTQGRAVALRMAMSQMREDLGTVDNSAGNLSDAWTALSVTFKNWVDDVAESFSENQRLVDFFVDLNEKMQSTLPSGDQMADVLVDVAEALLLMAQYGVKATDVLVAGFNGLIKVFDVMNALNPLSWIYEPEIITSMRELGASSEEAMGLMRDSIEGAQDSFESLNNEIAEGTETQAEDVLDLGSAWTDLLGIFDTPINFGGMFSSLDSYSSKMEQVNRDIAEYESSLNTAGTATEIFASANDLVAESAEEASRRIREEEQAVRQLATIMAEEGDAIDMFLSGGTARGRDPLHERADEEAGGRGRGRGRRGPSRREREAEEQARQMRLMFADMDQEARAYEAVLENIVEENDQQLVQLRLITAEMDEHQRARERNLEQIEQEVFETERLAQKHREMRQAERAAAEARHEQGIQGAEVAAQGLDLVGNTVGQMIAYQEQQVGNLRAAMQAAGKSQAEIAKATKTQVEQIERLKKVEGAFLVAYNVVKAAIAIAEAVSSFAKGEYLAGAMHILSAAAFGVAAGMAAARLGGGSASIPAAPSAGTFKESKPKHADTAGPKGEGVRIVNIYSLGRDKGSIGQAMEEAQWDRRRQALPRGGLEGVQYDA